MSRGRQTIAAALALVALSAAGCADDIQGHLRMLLVPPHQGRNPTADPFAEVKRLEVGLLSERGQLKPLGSSLPEFKFGPGLIAPGQSGAPYVLGLNDQDRAVAQGFGPALALAEKMDRTLSIPFGGAESAAATAAFPGEPVLGAALFSGKPASLFIDPRHLETGTIDSPADLSALVTALWVPGELLLQVAVTDDQITPVPTETPLSGLAAGDAIRIYLGAADPPITVSADGRVFPENAALEAIAEPASWGYTLRLRLALDGGAKNQAVPFDLRVYDLDGTASVAQATWRFDPARKGADPLPADLGELLLTVPLLDLLTEPGADQSFPGVEGTVRVQGSWDEIALHLTIQISDSEVMTTGSAGNDFQGADRVELWLDLVNGKGPRIDPYRFIEIITSAGSGEVHKSGSAEQPTNMEVGGFNFSDPGYARAARVDGGYQVKISLPWSNLRLNAGVADQNWFWGIEIVVRDEDTDGVKEASWSGSVAQDVRLWPELRMFSLE